ncbi:hypothetical protein F4821DRAFT_234383 [Hypoxylon rubiginosum]|uniref:Uncharacterized protein n=1 Tax=Hypoxylon rubiginosum TaxID=110542 RepID=A0ACC0D6P0_9PEZI|nr:hypothetical protein F4821DRAFT_234383 [Hypoxylon rubiginosum]
MMQSEIALYHSYFLIYIFFLHQHLHHLLHYILHLLLLHFLLFLLLVLQLHSLLYHSYFLRVRLQPGGVAFG